MKKIFAALMSLLLIACASHSGVVPMSKNSYVITKQAATGFSGLGNLKVEVMQEANEHCTSQKKNIKVIKYDETKPPYILGNYPRVELEFACEA